MPVIVPRSTPAPNQPSARVFRERFTRVWVVGLVGSLLALTAFWLAWRAQADLDKESFDRKVTGYLSAFRERRDGTEDVLRTLRAMFHQDPDLNRALFFGVVQDLAIRLDGVQAIVWAPRVVRERREAVESSAREEGFADFRISEGDLIHATDRPPGPAGERPEYFPVMYLEPYAGNEVVLGYDLYSVPEIRAALDSARDSGGIRISGAVNVRYESAIVPGVVATIPVYHPTLKPRTLEERRAQLRGHVLVVFVLERTMQLLADQIPKSGLDVMLTDASAGPERGVLHYHSGAGGKQAPPLTEAEFRKSVHHGEDVAMAGRQWRLLFRRGERWDSGQPRWVPFAVLAAGLIFTGFLAQSLAGSNRRAREIEDLVRVRTAELAATAARLQEEVHSRRRAQSELTHERNLLRTLIDRLPDAIFVTDTAGRYLMLNQAHARLLKLTDEGEGLQRAVVDVGHPALAQTLEAGSVEVRRSGIAIVDREETVAGMDGRDLHLLMSQLPVRNAQGGVDGLVVVIRDVSLVRRAELEKVEFARRLQETQKLESLGLLAGGIAHDFNNLLTSVLGNVGLARLDLDPDSPALGPLGQIEKTAVRAADLCRQMLAYSGKGRYEVRRIDISHLVEETTGILRLAISKKAVLKLQLSRALPTVMADATQLHQILMNLVINASDALRDGSGFIRIDTGLQRIEQESLPTLVGGADAAPGDYVYLEVSDNGCGMDEATAARIFDPFFTTKFTGRGLGLAAVLGIVRGHCGAIQLSSEPGEGTTFRLLLPAASGPAESEAAPETMAESWSGSGTLLVADDEDTVRAVAARILEKIGFEVDLAGNGREAVALFAADPDRYRAVLLDLTMPQMDGEQAFREIRLLRPEARVLLMSGFSSHEAVNRFAGQGLGGFVPKPFGAEQLRAAVRDLLEPSPS